MGDQHKRNIERDYIPFPWKTVHETYPEIYQLVFPDPVPESDRSKPRQKYFIDTLKIGTLPFCLWLSQKYSPKTLTFAVYTAMHGTYGLLWALKSQLYGDPKWNRRVPWKHGISAAFGLMMFWVIPWRLAKFKVERSPARLLCMIMAYIFGIFMHFTSDMQKSISLEMRPGKLITNKLFALCRHPNYFGEFLIYSSFVGIGDSSFMGLYFISFVMAYWVPNMIWKERSMSRYDEWQKYCAETKAFIPFFF